MRPGGRRRGTEGKGTGPAQGEAVFFERVSGESLEVREENAVDVPDPERRPVPGGAVGPDIGPVGLPPGRPAPPVGPEAPDPPHIVDIAPHGRRPGCASPFYTAQAGARRIYECPPSHELGQDVLSDIPFLTEGVGVVGGTRRRRRRHPGPLFSFRGKDGWGGEGGTGHVVMVTVGPWKGSLLRSP